MFVAGDARWPKAADPVPEGNPAAGVRTLAVPPLEPWALIPAQVRCRAEVTEASQADSGQVAVSRPGTRGYRLS
jgi:hypothetical protein